MQATVDFSDQTKKTDSSKRKLAWERQGTTTGGGSDPLADLVQPVKYRVHYPSSSALMRSAIPLFRESVGSDLLRRMGWRPGQGIGPRVSRKAIEKSKQKIYGCELPQDESGIVISE